MQQGRPNANMTLLGVTAEQPNAQMGVSEREQLERKIKELEERKRLEAGLPHLYEWPWYQWAWDFFQSRNRYNFLCAANQISKSSTMIRKCIYWATTPELWPKLWQRTPTQFWWIGPSLDVLSIEFHDKWVKEFLPRGQFKEHPVYGWSAEFKQKKIHAIHFNSGVTLYFKSYEMDVRNLQTASVFALFCDEEMPVELYPELNARISAASVRGYFHMVFTATIGQEFWRTCIEERGTAEETFKKAFKLQVSLYDSVKYMDGTPSPWSKPGAIQDIIDSCSTEAEVLRRVWGRFVVDADRKYPSFSRKLNCAKGHPLPKSWMIFAGVDIGSGGTSGHPAAIAFVAVNREFTQARVFKGWRGDGIPTTAGDILLKYKELRGKMKPVGEFYDSQSADFKNIAASSKGTAFQKADKGQDTGSTLINTLFKSQMLQIYSDEPELMKLVLELESLKTSTPKPKAKDDFIDALRFAVTKIPWDFAAAARVKKEKQKPEPRTEREKFWKEQQERKDRSGLDLIEAEIDLANEAIEYFDDGDGLPW